MESDFSDCEDTTPSYVDKDFDMNDFEKVAGTSHNFESSTDRRITQLQQKIE